MLGYLATVAAVHRVGGRDLGEFGGQQPTHDPGLYFTTEGEKYLLLPHETRRQFSLFGYFIRFNLSVFTVKRFLSIQVKALSASYEVTMRL